MRPVQGICQTLLLPDSDTTRGLLPSSAPDIEVAFPESFNSNHTAPRMDHRRTITATDRANGVPTWYDSPSNP